MASVSGVPTAGATSAGSSSTANVDQAIADMTAAFNQAIARSAEITAITTEKKVELDAAKQRPQG